MCCPVREAHRPHVSEATSLIESTVRVKLLHVQDALHIASNCRIVSVVHSLVNSTAICYYQTIPDCIIAT